MKVGKWLLILTLIAANVLVWRTLLTATVQNRATARGEAGLAIHSQTELGKVSARVQSWIEPSATTIDLPEPFHSRAVTAADESSDAISATSLTITLPGMLLHGSRTRREIALTFDACEINSAGYDAGVVKALIASQAPATLFLGGKWMLDHPTATRALAQVPYFELANHSYDHPHFSQLTPAQVSDEVSRTTKIMQALTGKTTHLFRFPYGEATAAAIKEINALGYDVIQFDDISGDPDPNETTPVEIAQVLRYAQNGSIIVMHMNGRGWHTAAALPTIIRTLRARGFKLVTVSQLLAGMETGSPLAPIARGVPLH